MGFFNIEAGINRFLEEVIPLDKNSAREMAEWMLSFYDLDYEKSDYNPVRRPPRYVEIVREQRKRR